MHYTYSSVYTRIQHIQFSPPSEVNNGSPSLNSLLGFRRGAITQLLLNEGNMGTSQLIDAQGEFTGALPASDARETRSYNIVAVVGCQSGGKSTLLNHTFGTDFPVLDAPKKGRRRTTLGVWGAVTTTASGPMVVLDVEGTDSRERGEGAKSFESRTTLFTLALADCVLVNMWAHDIGRYSAANYELFETVFAHAIALRKSVDVLTRHAVSVLIVVRDHDGESAVSDIRRVLMGDLINIWNSLRVKDISFTDVFQIDVIALPHKMYAEGAFADGVRHLAKRVASDTEERRKAQLVPLEGFDTLAKTVWTAVCACTSGNRANDMENQFTLDLPKHATLTAHFKCGEIVTEIWQGEVGRLVDELRTDIESQWQKPISDYRSRVDKIVNDSFGKFDTAAAAYRDSAFGADSVKSRRAELGVELASRVAELRERFLSVCREFCMNGFDDTFRPMLGGTNGYERSARRLARTHVSQYRVFFEEAEMPSVIKGFIPSSEGQEGDAEEGESEEVAVVEEVDAMDVELGLVDSDDEEGEEYSVEKFEKEVMQKVEERKRIGELLLPGNAGNYGAGGAKRDPWWKGLLIRALILFINYMQATQGQRAALKLHKKHEKEFPPGPTF